MSTTTTPTLRRLLAALALLAAAFACLAPRPALAAPADRPLVVLGAPGLTWDDITPDAAPHLTALAREGGTANLVVRTIHDATCPADGWLTLGAGARATTPKGPCRPLTPPVKGAVPGWAQARTATHDSLSGAHLGTLTGALPRACAIGPGAALALAGPDGRIGATWPTAGAAAITAAKARCSVLLVDLGSVAAGPTRAAQVKALDARAGQAVAAAGPGADIVLASLADDGAARLRPLVVRSAATNGRVLTSSSTKQPGLVLLTDLAPTLVAMRHGTAPATWTGHPATAGAVVAPDTRLADARDLGLLARTAQPLALPLVAWTACGAVVVALALALARRRTAAAVVLTLAGAIPAASFLARLVPWWRTGTPGLALAALTLGLAAALAALAWLGPWRRAPYGPAAVVALATAGVIMADVATGSRVTIASVFGEQPAVGGRFYGLGNVSSGLLAAATLLVMACLVEAGLTRGHHRIAAVIALLLGLAVVAFVAAPQLGADAGGPAALLPAVVYLGLRGTGMRLDIGRVAALGVVTVALVAVACFVDWLRPAEQRTHLGRFADVVINGGGGDVIGRKLIQNWTILTSSPATMAIPVLLAVVGYIVWRPSRLPRKPLNPLFERQPLLRIGLLAIVLMLVLASLLNDSGVTVPAPVAVLVVPLALAWALRTRRAR